MPEKIRKHSIGDEDSQNKINLLDFIIIFAKQKNLIIIITFSIALLTAIQSLFSPNMYMATTRILLPGSIRESMPMQLLGQFIDMSSAPGSANYNPDLYMKLLTNNDVLDRIIDKFDLTAGFPEGTDNIRDKIRENLAGQISSKYDSRKVENRDITVHSLILISVIDKDYQLAADIANSLVDELKKYLKDISLTESSRKRLFFETQMKEAKESLRLAEEDMQSYQETTGLLKVEKQAMATIDSMLNLRAQIASKEVELMVMKTYSTVNHPDVQKIEQTIEGFKIELSKLKEHEGNTPSIIVPVDKMPKVGTDYSRKLRTLTFNTTMYGLMAKQYKLAVIEEANEPIMIQVIEKATPRKTRVGPKRKQRVLKATASAFLFSVLLVLLLEYLNNVLSVSSENREKIVKLKQLLSFKRKNTG